MINHTTRSAVSTRYATSAVKRDIKHPIAQRKNCKYNDDKSTNTTSSRASVKKMEKYIIEMSRAFTTVNTQIQRLKEADSDLY